VLICDTIATGSTLKRAIEKMLAAAAKQNKTIR